MDKPFDVAIIGGGLAGLSLSILLKRKGYSTCVFEKEIYPIHKVCGEYVAMESFQHLENIGVPLSTLNLPTINKLRLTSQYSTLSTDLGPGGFGISRFLLDKLLYNSAITHKVTVFSP